MLTRTTILAALAVAPVAMSQGVLKANNGDNGVTQGQGEGNLPGSTWPGDLPVSDETILTNLELYTDREDIALLAVWVGAGPTDINDIIAGNPGRWLEDFREQARNTNDGDAPRAGVRVLSVDSPKSRRISGLKGAARASDIGGPTDFGDAPDNTTRYASRLWPVVEFNGQFVAQIPYTFDDDMIAAWQVRGATDDPEQLNAIAGISSMFATMLIIEQFAPVQFVGFNPLQDPANGFLLVTSSLDADFDLTTGLGVNTVTRIGRAASNPASEEEPTNIIHETWSNFPSIVRSLGFVMGLDWEQKRQDADDYIFVQPQNLPPANFPQFQTFTNGNLGPGVTVTPVSGGPLFFDTSTEVNTDYNSATCGFDFESMMLLRPLSILSGLPAYIIRDPYRYIDLNGDSVIDVTPFGPDDRMYNERPSVFFSDCDLELLTELYTNGPTWFYGQNPNCPHDVNSDGIQGGDDINAFIALWEAGHAVTDLVPPFGVINLQDLQAFTLGDEDNGIEIFTPGFCHDLGLPGPGFLPDDRINNPPG
jgi:hypothetical protein